MLFSVDYKSSIAVDLYCSPIVSPLFSNLMRLGLDPYPLPIWDPWHPLTPKGLRIGAEVGEVPIFNFTTVGLKCAVRPPLVLFWDGNLMGNILFLCILGSSSYFHSFNRTANVFMLHLIEPNYALKILQALSVFLSSPAIFVSDANENLSRYL